MSNRLYTAAVVVFWLGSMTWLVTQRILPPFFYGDAPPTSLAYQIEPVAWQIELDEKPCGVAVLQAVRADSGVREVHSLLRIDRLPVPPAAPLWLKPVLNSMKDLAVEMRTTTTYDSLGALSAFQTRMKVNHLDAPIRLSGRVIDDELRLKIRAAGTSREIRKVWPKGAALGGELAPASKLLPLWEGRRWTQEVYSPFASPKAPLEALEAMVTGQIRLTEGDQSVDVWTVEYRTAEKTGSTDEGRLRARLYVNELGRILKQEAFLLGSRVAFYRETKELSATMADELLELERYSTVYEGDGSRAGGAKAQPNEPLASPLESAAR